MLYAKNLTIHIGKREICKDLNLSLSASDIIGIIGPNGAGKTTLLHTLACLHPKTAGDLWLNQQPMECFSLRAIAQQIGILFQETPTLFPQSVLEYCLSSRFPHVPYFAGECQNDKEIVQRALSLLALEQLKNRSVTQLSGGEKKRLAIAALLAQTPSIYLLDEPFNHLDIRHQIRVARHFFDLAHTHQKAVVISLHDINFMRYCNYALMLFGNGKVLYGTPQEIMTEDNLTELYEHPIKIVRSQDEVVFLPEAISYT